jgi:hypothetical protein
MGRSLQTPVRLAVMLVALAAQPVLASVHRNANEAEADPVEKIILSLPKPPAVETLIGLKAVPATGRSHYLAVVAREAERRGLPTAVADAVVMIESAYNPSVVGTVGELGLMQVRPGTAAMLGFSGSNESLAEPETNVRYGVEYLAQAWRLSGGDLCRALMKYRAGHGEERMTPRSVEYCRRARLHLAAIGSPLANVATAMAAGPSAPVQVASAQPVQLGRSPRLTAEEQRRAAYQQELVRRFILAVAEVGSTGKTASPKQANRPSGTREAGAGPRSSGGPERR